MAPRMIRRAKRELRDYIDEPWKRHALRARFMRPYWRFRFREFGENSILHKPDLIYGPHHIAIGANVAIGHRVWLSAERSTWDREGAAIRIGDWTAIGPYCRLVAAEGIELEDSVGLGAFSTVIDNDHTWEGGTSAMIVWHPLRISPVRIGRGTFIGERTTVLRGSNIGRFCAIGANSVVRGEIPDFSIAVGVPARVVGSTEDQVRHLIDD